MKSGFRIYEGVFLIQPSFLSHFTHTHIFKFSLRPDSQISLSFLIRKFVDPLSFPYFAQADHDRRNYKKPFYDLEVEKQNVYDIFMT